MHRLELGIPPVVVVLALAALMWGVARLLPGLQVTLPAGGWIAAGLTLAGASVAILGVVSFHRARTTLNPLHPEAASALVVAGIYRVTRNPMYVGMLLVLLGWAVLLAHGGTWIVAAAFVPLMNRLQIIPEERALTARFGTTFTNYQARVRRWL